MQCHGITPPTKWLAGMKPTLLMFNDIVFFWKRGDAKYHFKGGGWAAAPAKSAGFLSKLFGRR